VKTDDGWIFVGTVVWLTSDQGGRTTGPPLPNPDIDYFTTAYVPPLNARNGLASFGLRNFEAGAWKSPAEGRWLIVENSGDQLVQPGSVVVVTEGSRDVAYFHVEQVLGTQE